MGQPLLRWVVGCVALLARDARAVSSTAGVVGLSALLTGAAATSIFADDIEAWAREKSDKARGVADDAIYSVEPPPIRVVSTTGRASGNELTHIVLLVQPRSGSTAWMNDTQIILQTTSARQVNAPDKGPPLVANLQALRDPDGSLKNYLVNDGDLVELSISLGSLPHPIGPGGVLKVVLQIGAAKPLIVQAAVPPGALTPIVDLRVSEIPT